MMEPLLMTPHQHKGYLFTFCGLDGCGKTTMMRRLTEDLEKNHSVFLTKQPTEFVRTTGIFRTYMDSPNHDAYDYRSLSLLAASDRIQHTNKVIQPALEQGEIVLSDRYFYSCLANLRARGYEEDQWIYEISRSIIQPDIAFFLDVPVEKAIERVRMRPTECNRYIDLELQYRLRDQYQTICQENHGVLISTDCTEEESYALVKECVEKVIGNECK